VKEYTTDNHTVQQENKSSPVATTNIPQINKHTKPSVMHDDQNTTVRPTIPNNNQCTTASDQSPRIQNVTHTVSLTTSVAISTIKPKKYTQLPTAYQSCLPEIPRQYTITPVILCPEEGPHEDDIKTYQTTHTSINETYPEKQQEQEPQLTIAIDSQK